MLSYEILESERILQLFPQEPLRKEDFESLSRDLKPYFENGEGLEGVLIQTREFPGWEDMKGFLSHISFIREHHAKIKKVAAVTDSKAIPAMQSIGQYFVSADVRQFKLDEKTEALSWLRN